MSSLLMDRLMAARHDRFVGRTDEQAIFQSLLDQDELEYLMLHIYGPGGFGKTTLLNEFVRACRQRHIPAFFIDARHFEPTPEAFLDALQSAMGIETPPLNILGAASQRHVILIDTYELLAPLEGWLRDTFLPHLSANVLTVVAGRNPPSPTWRSDPGWQSLIRVIPLRNLSRQESQTFLSERHIPADRQQEILDFTYGHPLALALVADTFAQQQDLSFKPDSVPDVIRILVERFIHQVPSSLHRAALEACALARVTDEALLAALQELEDSHELFDWLRSLSFIELGPHGLYPHDLTRDVLITDLRWRNSEWYTTLHQRAQNYYATRLRTRPESEQTRLLFDFSFLHRDNPAVRPFFDWQERGSMSMTPMTEADRPALLSVIEQYEGRESAQLADLWMRRQPQSVRVIREGDDKTAGFIMTLALHRASAAEIAADVGANAVWQYLQKTTRIRPGEAVLMFRFWMARETYQSVSPVQSVIFVAAVQYYLTTPGLVYTFLPCADPDFWVPMFAYADIIRIPDADFEVDGKRFGMYGHDWRVVPPTAWLDLLAQREIGSQDARQITPPPRQLEPMVVLSHDEFKGAVQNALRSYHHPDELRENPLLRSRLVVQRADSSAGEAEMINALQSILRETAGTLDALPRERKFYRALYSTYFHPAPTQEQAAELLSLPFSTYRRHVKTGVERMVELLWQQEIGVAESTVA